LIWDGICEAEGVAEWVILIGKIESLSFSRMGNNFHPEPRTFQFL
jgi:hypothetical protein